MLNEFKMSNENCSCPSLGDFIEHLATNSNKTRFHQCESQSADPSIANTILAGVLFALELHRDLLREDNIQMFHSNVEYVITDQNTILMKGEKINLPEE